MNKEIIEKLDLELYTKTLKNGLSIYIVPKPDSNNIYVTCTVKYGSSDVAFKSNDTLHQTPFGIAHFLEHKMFEQEDKTEPFKEFDKNGASANAYTNYQQTTYLFSGPDNLEKNIKILLDYLSKPYFTDENVEKEKGIILQELQMYKDSPYRRGFEEVLKNAFFTHPIREPVGGTKESVKKTTKDDLYLCYNNFYTPKNMFMVITGNVDPKQVETLIEKNFTIKPNSNHVIPKQYSEKDQVKVKENKIEMNVTIPKVNYGIKLNLNNTDLTLREFRNYLSIFLDANFGGTSDFTANLKEKGIIDTTMDYINFQTDKHMIVIFTAETKKYKELIREIKKTFVQKPDILTFERKKRMFISSIIYTSDNIYSINDMITSAIINYGKFNTKLLEHLNRLNYLDFIKMIENLDFSNDTTLIVEPKA